ncbi:CHAT domain-containing protein [Streptomyces sp. NPDC102415]|uniref:CHAT domain-containing protein n=1 Tax=Streptomyces sp. NPDC102415 TaxID=3366173 RepID=UPI00382A2CDD
MARDMFHRLGGQGPQDLTAVEQQLARLSALAPGARRDAMAALPPDEREALLVEAFGHGATREDPWNSGADAKLLATVLEAYAAGIVVGSGKEWESARHAKDRLSAQAQLLRAVEADAAGDLSEANRLFRVAHGRSEAVGDWLVGTLGLLGRTACGSEAHLADPAGIMDMADPLMDELAQAVGEDLSPLRQAFHLRYEAFSVVRAAVGAGDMDALLSLVRSWLGPNPPGAMVELFHAWRDEMRRGIEDGDLDWAISWAALGDQLVAPARPGSPFRAGLADHFRASGDWERAVQVLEWVLADEPDDEGLLVALAGAYQRAGRGDEAIACLRSRLSDPPAPGEEDLLDQLVRVLIQEGSPELEHWEGELIRLTGAGARDMLPKVFGAPPAPQVAMAHFADGALTISPDIDHLSDIGPQIFAAMIEGSPDGADMLRDLAESDPVMAADVARLLGVPLMTRAHREAAQHIEQGEQHFHRREYAEAAACYYRALEADPDSAAALLVLGDVYYVNRHLGLARAYFQESLAVEETPMAWRFLGDTYRAEQDGTEEARNCYRRALALDPDYGGARQALEHLPPPAGPLSPTDTVPPSAPPSAEGRGAGTAVPRPGIPMSHFAAGPGVEADLPLRLETALRRDHPALGIMFDSLADDEEFARWLAEHGPAHWSRALVALKVLIHQWAARGTDLERSLLLAGRRLQIAEALVEPWPEGDDEDMGRARLLAEALEQLASVNKELGRYTESYDLLKAAERWTDIDEEERTRAGKSLRAAPDHFHDRPARAGLYESLADAALLSGDETGAAHYTRLQREVEEGLPAGDHERVVEIVTTGLSAYLLDDDPDLALLHLRTAEKIAERESARTPVKVTLATVQYGFGRLLTWLGLPRQALHRLGRARELNSGNADRLAQDWLATAEVLDRWPRFGPAMRAYEQVLVLASVPGSIEDRLFWAPRGEPTSRTGRRVVAVERAWTAVLPMARAAWAYGELYTATDVLELGVGLADLVRAAQPDPDLRMRVQDERAVVFELLTRFRLERAECSDGDPGEHVAAAYTASERKRSRALLDAMSTARLRAPAGVPQSLMEREAELLGARTEVESGDAVDWTRHHALTDELAALWAQMSARGPEAAEYAAIRQSDVLAPADVLTELAGEPVVVASYAMLDDGPIVLFVLSGAAGLQVTHIDADGPQLLRFIEDHFGSAGQVREMAEDMPGLYQHVLGPLVAPLAAAARPGQTVLICPTGALHHVPFHSLAVEGSATLLDRNPVAYLPTVSLLRTLNHRVPGAGTGAVILGDPCGDLPYAREEAVALGNRLGAVPLLGEAATREQVLRRVPHASVFHAACHARFDAQDPLSSGLVLAGEVLTARDILRQDWHGVRLAVLSACETGVGRTSRTDETLGLSRSLLFAGVRSLVMSLWRVPDSTTAAIMGDFHDLALDGEAPAQALRTALLAARDRPGGSRLDRWAAFCLLGDWRAPAGAWPRHGD